MNRYVIFGAGLFMALGGLCLFLFNGAGGLRRMVTLSGIYTVADPGGYPVVCFVDKGSRAMDCIPKTQFERLK